MGLEPIKEETEEELEQEEYESINSSEYQQYLDNNQFSAENITAQLEKYNNKTKIKQKVGENNYSTYNTLKGYTTYIPQYGPYIRSGLEIGEGAYELYLNYYE